MSRTSVSCCNTEKETCSCSPGKWVWFVYLSIKHQTGKVSCSSVHNSSVRYQTSFESKNFCFLIIYKPAGQNVVPALEGSDGEIKKNMYGTFFFLCARRKSSSDK